MFAFQLISPELFALKKSDSCESALVFMQDWGVKHLPVVENQKVLGYVNKQILQHDETKKVEQVLLNSESFFVNENTHVFDVLKTMHDTKCTTIAVVDEQQNFKGIINSNELTNHVFFNSSLKQEGGIIVLEINAHNYSLAEISRITEVNDTKIISLMVQPVNDDNNTILVSLKFNKPDLKFVISTFERFSYTILYAKTSGSNDVDLEDRYNWLLKFINT